MNNHQAAPQQAAFTLLEILVVVLIVGLLGAVSLVTFQGQVKKSEAVEAYVNIGTIRRAEEKAMSLDGNYVAAEGSADINQKLDVAILPRKYEYSVVNVTEKDFIVIARRLDEDLSRYFSQGIVPAAPIVIAANNTGLVTQGYAQYLPGGADIAAGSGGGSGSAGGGSGSGSSGGSGGGSAGGLGSGGSGGGSSGGSGSGGSGGSGGGSSGESGSGSSGGSGGATAGVGSSLYAPPDTLTTGGWSHLAPANGSGGPVQDGIQPVLDLLKTSQYGSYAYDLIRALQIPLEWQDLGTTRIAQFDPNSETISISTAYKNEPLASLAASLAHEATHADYHFFSDAWIAKTLERHPEVTVANIHITQSPGDSIDQEFNAICNGARVWTELRGTAQSEFQDNWMMAYDQGEDYLKDAVRRSYASQGLPEY